MIIILIETAHAINRTVCLQFSQTKLNRMISLMMGFANTHAHKMHDNARKIFFSIFHMLMQWLVIFSHFDFECYDWSVWLNIMTISKDYCFHITHTSSSHFAEHHLETNCKTIWYLFTWVAVYLKYALNQPSDFKCVESSMFTENVSHKIINK